jgi:hypothetical protein
MSRPRATGGAFRAQKRLSGARLALRAHGRLLGCALRLSGARLALRAHGRLLGRASRAGVSATPVAVSQSFLPVGARRSTARRGPRAGAAHTHDTPPRPSYCSSYCSLLADCCCSCSAPKSLVMGSEYDTVDHAMHHCGATTPLHSYGRSGAALHGRMSEGGERGRRSGRHGRHRHKQQGSTGHQRARFTEVIPRGPKASPGASFLHGMIPWGTGPLLTTSRAVVILAEF